MPRILQALSFFLFGPKSEIQGRPQTSIIQARPLVGYQWMPGAVLVTGHRRLIEAPVRGARVVTPRMFADSLEESK